jgi:6-phosphogluconolactonase (cycloisomerase 2 family)
MDWKFDIGGRARAAVPILVALLPAVIAACGGSSGSEATFPVGGTIAGLTTGGLVLTNGTDTVRPSPGSNSFQFPTRVPSGDTYDVSVSQQPTGLTCGVHNGSGTAGPQTPATNVSVFCVSGQQFVYGGGDLFTLDPASGALTLQATYTNCCVGAVTDPLGHFFYGIDSFSLGIDSWSIDPATGLLTALAQISPPAPAGFVSLVTDPTGQYLYATVAQQPSIYAYAIGTGGTLTPLPNSPFAAASFPVALALDPSGPRLYAANMQDGNISGYAINSDGSLTSLSGSPFSVVAPGAGLDDLVAAPGGGFLYAHAGVGTGSGIYAFSINSQSGALTALAGNPYDSPQNGPSSLALGLSGAFIFLANVNSNAMSVATINTTTGAPSVVAGSPFPGGGITGQIAPDALGAFVYTAGSGSISGFAFNSTTGALSVLPTSPYISGTGTYLLVVRPSP